MPDSKIVSQVSDPVSGALRKEWQDNDVVVLWESENGNLPEAGGEQSRHWPWATMRPIMLETAKITLPSIVERRVMQLVNPTASLSDADATSGLLNGGIQALMPGEHARPHRHSMNALRFILEGTGAETVIEGKSCRMEFGDLITTPGDTWHEHRNTEGTPTIWIDILDVALHRALGTASFEPGPVTKFDAQIDDAAFATANIVPVEAASTKGRSYSPVFRYPWIEAKRALIAAPVSKDGARRVRYIDPLNGGAILPTIDCYLMQVDEGETTERFRSSANSICVVVEGEGETNAGEVSFNWSAGDVFTLPQNEWVDHIASSGPARIFIASNREVYRRLGLLREGFWSQRATPASERDIS
jgi:gentisate 1,2-dioxygenase